MKKKLPASLLATLLLSALILSPLQAEPIDLSQTLPTVALKDGRVLQNVQITTYKTETVFLRHRHGAAVVRYEYLPADIRIAAEQKRPGGPRILPGEILRESDGERIAGQVFITTVGQGSYKFTDITVYALPITAASAWRSRTDPVRLPKPLAKSLTDADGTFELHLPPGQPFILFAQASRGRVSATQSWQEHYEWRAPSSEIEDKTRINLSTDWRTTPRPVQISDY